MKYCFYDTCSLLLKGVSLFENSEEFPVFSSITINELENIKTSNNKDETVRAQARTVLRCLEENKGKYDIVLYHPDLLKPLEKHDFDITNDIKILACAIYYQDFEFPITFISNDLILKQIALNFFEQDKITSVGEDEDDYTGYIELVLNDDEIANFYNSNGDFPIDLLFNQYLLLKNTNGEIFDLYKRTEKGLEKIKYPTFDSYQFGPIKPKDSYQAIAMDSMLNNKVTLIGGLAGSGKTYLALSALFHKLDKGEIDRIIVFCNPVVARGAAKLGLIQG